MTVELESRFRV